MAYDLKPYICVRFSDVSAKVQQKPGFDMLGFQAHMGRLFEDDTPVEILVKDGPVYLRRSRTLDSGYRLEAFEGLDFNGSKRLGYMDLEVQAGRVCVENVFVWDKRRGVAQGLNRYFAEQVHAFKGKLNLSFGMILSDGRAVLQRTAPHALALRDLYLKLAFERNGDNPNPSVNITPEHGPLWDVFFDELGAG
jgi:hypothetical protein